MKTTDSLRQHDACRNGAKWINAILAAFERQRDLCEQQLSQQPAAQRAMTEYPEMELAAASVLAVENEIKVWKKACAIVRSITGEAEK